MNNIPAYSEYKAGPFQTEGGKSNTEAPLTAVKLKCYFCQLGEQLSLVRSKIVTWEREWDRAREKWKMRNNSLWLDSMGPMEMLRRGWTLETCKLSCVLCRGSTYELSLSQLHRLQQRQEAWGMVESWGLLGNLCLIGNIIITIWEQLLLFCLWQWSVVS